MVDTHYDLLTICYNCYLKKDYSKIESIANEIKSSGVKCIFANLYFMSKEEMIEEIDPKYYDPNVSILEMFKKAKSILESYLPNIDFIYSIEGCDYLKVEELDDLYNEGLRSILLVWNCENKYGSGNRSNKGLTKEGIEFLDKAIDLGIGIDLSHANIPTFYGMIELIRERQKEGKDVICYASHSNVRTLCDRDRNLNDDQIRELKTVGGLLGLFSNRNFVTKDHSISKDSQKEEYLKHIMHAESLIGSSNIMLSTDDMRFNGDIDPECFELSIFNYDDITNEVIITLRKCYSAEDVNKMLYENAYNRVINKLKVKKEVIKL